jgi:hypothetical protein
MFFWIVFLEIWRFFSQVASILRKEYSFLKIIFLNLAKLLTRVPILDKLKINSRRFWRDRCLRPPFHPQKQSNRAQIRFAKIERECVCFSDRQFRNRTQARSKEMESEQW